MSVANELARLIAANAKSKAIDDVVKTALKKLEEIMSCLSRHVCSLIVYCAELSLVKAVEAAKLLLLAKTESVFTHLSAAGTMLSRLGITLCESAFLCVAAVSL